MALITLTLDIDLELMAKQKQYLIDAANGMMGGDTEELDGVINLLDAIQDEAEKIGQ